MTLLPGQENLKIRPVEKKLGTNGESLGGIKNILRSSNS
jgi:hypothetical protein